MAYRDLLREMQWLSVRPSVEDELGDLFDSVVEMFPKLKESSNNHQPSEIPSLCLASMKNTSQVYRAMGFSTERIDFSDPITQWSYMFVYMLRHVHLVFYALDQAFQMGELDVDPSNQPRNVCMIGGGPGSDVLGIGLFLMRHGCTGTLTDQVHVLDRCPEWLQSWRELHGCLPERYREGIPDAQYHPFDYVENKLTREQSRCVEDAKIVTMIKSLSPAAAWLRTKQKSDRYMIGEYGQMTAVISEWHSVYEILKAMKPGAYLLYIDNETGPQRQILMDSIQYLKFDVLFDRVLRDVRMSSNIFSISACQLITTLDYKPCTVAGTNEVILLRKRSP